MPPWRAGVHAYVSAPSLSWFPQSHPFTIASTPEPLIPAGSPPSPGESEKAQKRELEKLALDVTRIIPANTQERRDMLFIIRARDGFTERLLQHARRALNDPNNDVGLQIFGDGPYSSIPPLEKRYDMVVLVADKPCGKHLLFRTGKRQTDKVPAPYSRSQADQACLGPYRSFWTWSKNPKL